MRSNTLRRRGALAAISVAVAVISLVALPLEAGAAVYPPGGGAFATDAEGWQVTEEDCNIALTGVCAASGGHDSEAGNPAGSLAADTSIVLNAGGLFESTVAFASPDFTVAEGGPALVHIDREFEPGGLLALDPEATYAVDVIDRGTESSTQALSGTLGESDSTFAGQSAAVTVAAGHAYALSIVVDVGSTTASIGLLGDAVVRLDNVFLSAEEASLEEGPGEGPSGGPGGSTVATAHDASAQSTTVREAAPSAGWRGRHVFVRLRCPRRARHACTITAQGGIEKRILVTQRRSVRVGKGRSRLVSLRVKRRFREKVAGRKRLLVVQTVRIGRAKTTSARSCALIRRR